LLIHLLALKGARAVAQAIVSADGEPLSVLTFGDNDSMNIPMQDCHRSPQVLVSVHTVQQRLISAIAHRRY
jgi:hypothetical protein